MRRGLLAAACFGGLLPFVFVIVGCSNPFSSGSDGVIPDALLLIPGPEDRYFLKFLPEVSETDILAALFPYGVSRHSRISPEKTLRVTVAPGVTITDLTSMQGLEYVSPLYTHRETGDTIAYTNKVMLHLADGARLEDIQTAIHRLDGRITYSSSHVITFAGPWRDARRSVEVAEFFMMTVGVTSASAGWRCSASSAGEVEW